jgi:hypothetical protein
MKWFDVRWTQHHQAKVRAMTKEDAKTIAVCLHDAETLKLISGTTVVEERP